MSDKKRKAAAQEVEQPRKKPHNAKTVTVTHRSGRGVAKPTIGAYQLHRTRTAI